MMADLMVANSWKRALVVALIACVVGALAISGQSFWMDEGSTIFRAMMPTLGEWWKMTTHLGGSDVQMPIYMGMVWAWEKLGADSEYALRMINLPWVVLGAVSLYRVRGWGWVYLSSPFVWYYAGELRPYAMQIAGGCVAAWALARVADRGESPWRGLHASAAAILLLVASSLSAAVWAAGVALGVWILRPDWPGRGGFWLRLLPWLLPFGALGAYYGFTLVEGYRATSVGAGGLASLLFGIYELTGMVGLGPGRDALRADPGSVVAWLPLIVPAGLVLGGLWVHGLWGWLAHAARRHLLAVGVTVVGPMLVLAAIGVLMDFRVLGRHMSPLLPVVLLPLAMGLSPRHSPHRAWVGRVLGPAAIGMMLTSAIRLRVAETHERDDYRAATPLAIEALRQGKRVLWLADMNAPRYYAYREGGMPLVHGIQILESNRPPTLTFADMVVINRPDLRPRELVDPERLEWNGFVKTHAFSGFEVWEME